LPHDDPVVEQRLLDQLVEVEEWKPGTKLRQKKERVPLPVMLGSPLELVVVLDPGLG
jgi:hypothetical protein